LTLDSIFFFFGFFGGISDDLDATESDFFAFAFVAHGGEFDEHTADDG
jgi:hypothetical protein